MLVQIYTSLLLMVVMYAVSYLMSMRDVANNDLWRTKAYYAAEGGVFKACEEIQKNNPASAFTYQIDGSSVKVEIMDRQSNQIVLKTSAVLPPYYAATFISSLNTVTGKIENWEEIK